MLEMFREIAKDYPDIEAEDMTVDACAMQIVMNPDRFGVVFAENANGDILSDVGAGCYQRYEICLQRQRQKFNGCI